MNLKCIYGCTKIYLWVEHVFCAVGKSIYFVALKCVLCREVISIVFSI